MLRNFLLKSRIGNQQNHSTFSGCKKLSPDESATIKSNLEKLLKEASVPGIGIPDYERKMVVQAMGLKQGHWYKCPNGHIYCIGDCGGAMMESRCNECGEIIGGESHRLRSDNTLAREMDGASTSAWPDRRF